MEDKLADKHVTDIYFLETLMNEIQETQTILKSRYLKKSTRPVYERILIQKLRLLFKFINIRHTYGF